MLYRGHNKQDKGEPAMERFLLVATGMVLLAMASGCNNAKTPDAVANDVASAQNKAASDVADARKDAAKDSASEQAKVDDSTQKLDATNEKGAYDVAIAKADGNKKIAEEQCNALSGDAQKACKDQADAKHDLAVANAKATLAAQKP
jgi:hypothetical protein